MKALREFTTVLWVEYFLFFKLVCVCYSSLYYYRIGRFPALWISRDNLCRKSCIFCLTFWLAAFPRRYRFAVAFSPLKIVNLSSNPDGYGLNLSFFLRPCPPQTIPAPLLVFPAVANWTGISPVSFCPYFYWKQHRLWRTNWWSSGYGVWSFQWGISRGNASWSRGRADWGAHKAAWLQFG